jgi:hypothetical protein
MELFKKINFMLHEDFKEKINNTWLDNNVCELATMCLPWQHWTKVLVWFDDGDISVSQLCC